MAPLAQILLPALFAAAAILATTTAAFYLPGIAPVGYEEGAQLEVIANKLTSAKNQLPYDYYALPFCNPDDQLSEVRVKSRPVNLGRMLIGERAKPTTFNISMLAPELCKFMCSKKLIPKKANLIKKFIADGYSVRLNMDNMPIVVRGQTRSGAEAFHFGYPLGFLQNGKHYINNYLKLKVLYHIPRDSLPTVTSPIDSHILTYRVVGFEVEPWSVQHNITLAKQNQISNAVPCPLKNDGVGQIVDDDVEVVFSYDVTFQESQLPWATRWDPLLNANPELRHIQWFSIVNSIMIGVFLTALVATIMLRTVLRDFVRYNQLDEEDEAEDVTGWKLVHGDVFRPPPMTPLLAVVNGSGAQVFWLAVVTLLFAVAGFLSPANRGGLLTAMLTLWVLLSTVAGYVSARLYASLQSYESRKYVTLGSALTFPGICFSIFFSINFLLFVNGSSGAVPFHVLLLLLFMWFGISVPLVFFGAYMGYKRKMYDFPVKTNQIPRQIPPPPFNIPPTAYVAFAGVLPFGTIFMELVFILNSIWQNQMYYMFGFLFLVFVILVVTCAEMSVVFTYLLLSNENYKWWWQSFLTSASSGVYVFIYSIYYLLSQPGFEGINFVSIIMYLGYMGIISLGFCLMTGFVGFSASFTFVRRIYSAIRID